jgi:hypothetical protein
MGSISRLGLDKVNAPGPLPVPFDAGLQGKMWLALVKIGKNLIGSFFQSAAQLQEIAAQIIERQALEIIDLRDLVMPDVTIAIDHV